MSEDVKATAGAKELAEEQGVNLASVEGSGKDGQVTKADVEAILPAEDEQAPPEQAERLIYAEFNPRLDFAPDRLTLRNPAGEARTFTADPNSRIMAESELADFNKGSKAPGGLQWLVAGKEA